MASFLSLTRGAAFVAALLVSGSAFAAYADLSPPPGWVRGGSGAPATMSAVRGSTMANSGEQIVAKIIANAGGRSVAVNARVPLDMAKAPSVAAKAIFRSPAAKAIPVIGTWFTIAGLGSWVWDEATRRWVDQGDTSTVESDGYLYGVPNVYRIPYEHYTPRSACEVAALMRDQAVPARAPHTCQAPAAGEVAGGWTLIGRDGSWSDQVAVGTQPGDCPAGWYVRWPDLACVQEPEFGEVSEQDFIDGLAAAPMPSGVPGELPDVGWPVKTPELQPTWVPVGDPVANPDYSSSDPESKPYKQPGVRVVPANDPDNPWRVDVRPEDRLLDEPTPMRDPVPLGDPNDWPTAETDPDTRPSDIDGLCALYPDISACQRLGEPEEAEALPEREIEIEIDAQDWGPADGVCPEPVSISVMGREFFVSWEPLCDLAERVRPLVIAFAWLAAALGVAGFGRRTS